MSRLAPALAVVVLALGLGSGLGRPAFADDREDARREFTAGQAADKDHDYANALAHYLRAYDLVPHPFAAFNIAVDSEHLGKLREAAKWYRQFLELDPASNDAAKTRALIADLAVRPSQVHVTSIPSGARILVDGAPAGATPAYVPLPGGPHRVSIELNGQHEDRQITTEYGEPQEVAFQAGGGRGTLLVYGTPPGATVYVDDQPAGQLPAQLQVQAGHHTVRVQQVGFQDTTETVDVAPSGVTRESINLTTGTSGGGGSASTITGVGAWGYLIGVSGGVDAKSADPALTADIGFRISRYELLAQLGHADGDTYINLLFRLSLSTARFSPFIGASLFYFVSSATETGATESPSAGFSAVGGFRYDFARSDHTTYTARATAGVGYFNESGTDTMGNPTSSTVITVPVMLSLEATIGRAQ